MRAGWRTVDEWRELLLTLRRGSSGFQYHVSNHDGHFNPTLRDLGRFQYLDNPELCHYSEWQHMPSDTHPDAERVQTEIFRRMTPGQRVEVAFEMSESIRNISLDGLRSRRPDLSREEALRELMRLMYGVAPKL